jgi:hypothetical protein
VRSKVDKVDVIKSVRVEGISAKALVPFLFFVMPQNFQEDCQGKNEKYTPVRFSINEEKNVCLAKTVSDGKRRKRDNR